MLSNVVRLHACMCTVTSADMCTRLTVNSTRVSFFFYTQHGLERSVVSPTRWLSLVWWRCGTTNSLPLDKGALQHVDFHLFSVPSAPHIASNTTKKGRSIVSTCRRWRTKLTRVSAPTQQALCTVVVDTHRTEATLAPAAKNPWLSHVDRYTSIGAVAEDLARGLTLVQQSRQGHTMLTSTHQDVIRSTWGLATRDAPPHEPPCSLC